MESPLSIKTSTTLVKLLLMFTMYFTCNHVHSAKVNIVTEHLVPYQIVQGNNISGLSTEIIEATFKAANIDYQIEAHPWSLSYNHTLKEQNTCIYSIVRIPEREKLFHWIGHITTISTSLYSLKDNPIQIETLQQAKKYKIAVIKNDVAHHYLLSQGFVENKNLYVMNNNNALLKLLAMPNRRIDLIVMNDKLLTSRLDNNADITKYKNVFKFKDYILEFYLACSLTTEKKTVNALNQAMKSLDKQGVFSAIKTAWRQKDSNISK